MDGPLYPQERGEVRADQSTPETSPVSRPYRGRGFPFDAIFLTPRQEWRKWAKFEAFLAAIRDRKLGPINRRWMVRDYQQDPGEIAANRSARRRLSFRNLIADKDALL